MQYRVARDRIILWEELKKLNPPDEAFSSPCVVVCPPVCFLWSRGECAQEVQWPEPLLLLPESSGIQADDQLRSEEKDWVGGERVLLPEDGTDGQPCEPELPAHQPLLLEGHCGDVLEARSRRALKSRARVKDRGLLSRASSLSLPRPLLDGPLSRVFLRSLKEK